jgi:hypothetical protein
MAGEGRVGRAGTEVSRKGSSGFVQRKLEVQGSGKVRWEAVLRNF